MNLSVGIVQGNTREDLLYALKELCSIDADFSGENGIEYNWKETIEEGYESNADYCLDKVKDLETDEEVISEFIKLWIENDHYYTDYAYDLAYEDNKVKCIAIATN